MNVFLCCCRLLHCLLLQCRLLHCLLQAMRVAVPVVAAPVVAAPVVAVPVVAAPVVAAPVVAAPVVAAPVRQHSLLLQRLLLQCLQMHSLLYYPSCQNWLPVVAMPVRQHSLLLQRTARNSKSTPARQLRDFGNRISIYTLGQFMWEPQGTVGRPTAPGHLKGSNGTNTVSTKPCDLRTFECEILSYRVVGRCLGDRGSVSASASCYCCDWTHRYWAAAL